MCHPYQLSEQYRPEADPKHALNFSLDVLAKEEPWAIPEFLEDWRKGVLEPWPEYLPYVNRQATVGLAI